MASGLKSLVLCVILAVVLQCRPSEGLRVLGIFPMPSRSHFSIDEKVMRALAQRGHQVDVYGHFPLKKPPPNYTDYSIKGSAMTTVNNITYAIFKTFSSAASIPQLIEMFGDPICNILDQPIFQKLIRTPPTDPPYDVVIIEPFFANCYLAFGRHLKIPMVMIVTTTLFEWLYEPLGNPTNFAFEPGVFTQSIRPSTFIERITNIAQSYWNIFTFNHLVRSQDAIVEKHFGPGYPNAVDLQKDIALTLVNYHYTINGVRAFTPNVLPVGGLHVADSQDALPKHIQTFLDESKNGFIYVSFGSMVRIETFPKSKLEAFYKTFKNIAPVRVLMKIAKPEELPKGLPSNVITYHWLPQVEVLKHKNIKVFVTHGGQMSTVESIYHGVPMIGFPLFADQYYSIESYVKKNMAIKLDIEKINEESYSKAVQKILADPIYRKSAEKAGNAMRDEPLNSMDKASFWIEYIVRHGKDVLRPPVVDLPWWQASLFDVYAFLLSIALIVLYILKVVIIKFIRLFCNEISNEISNEKLKEN